MSSRPRHLLAAAVALACLYALPLYFPPATSTIGPPPPGAGILSRLFPGVPAWWVLLRLICLGAAVLLTARGLDASWPSRESSPSDDHLREAREPSDLEASTSARTSLAWIALAIAALNAAAAWWAAELTRPWQLLYVAALALPAAVLALPAAFPSGGTSHRRGGGTDAASRSTRLLTLTTATIVIGYLLLRFAVIWHSARSTDAVDGPDGLTCIARAARDDFNVVTAACFPGYTALPVMLQGAGIVGRWVPMSFQVVQAIELTWIAVSAALVAWAASGLFGAHAAAVAAATFLFAPFELMVPMLAAGNFVFTVVGAAMVCAAVAARTGSPAAIAAFGALAGIGARCPPLILVVPVLAAWTFAPPLFRPAHRLPLLASITALLSFTAAFAPSVREWLNVGQAVQSYGHGGRGSWAVMEAALFGQFSPQAAEGAIGAASAHPLDVPLGVLVSPFAASRTAVRLWADAIFDPIGAVLIAVGLVAAFKATIARRVDAWMLLALTAAALLPGMLAGYDRPSLIRVAAAAVPLALLAGAGFETLRRNLVARGASVAATISVCAAIALSGTVQFDIVNPRILARSPLSIALARRESAGADVAVLDETLWKPRYTSAAAEDVPRKPLRVVANADLPELLRSATPPVIVWSPGVEEDYAVSRTICRAWPSAAIYELDDASSLTKVFAAGREPVAGWAEQPRDCSATLDTETLLAEHAIARASSIGEKQGLDEAAAVLEAQARQTFGYAPIFDATARALLAADSAPDELARAVEWASRACETSGREDPQFCSTLARAQAANGRYEDAIAAARVARDAALRRGQRDLASELELRIQEYAAAGSRREG